MAVSSDTFNTVALTATADPNTRQDILSAMKMQTAEVFLASFHRPNLHLAAEPKVGETAQLLSFLGRHKGACGIVYCGSRARTERVAAKLVEKGFPAVPFHAGLDPVDKRAAAERFRSGEPLLVVATIAFGMGIDRPDVRFVVHLDMPDSPEAYYQQIGRAGRDGALSRRAARPLPWQMPGRRQTCPCRGSRARRSALPCDGHAFGAPGR